MKTECMTHENIRLSIFVTIMLALTIVIIYFFRSPEFLIEVNNSMKQVVEVENIKDNHIAKEEICYLYLDDVLDGTIIDGTVVAQADSTVQNVSVKPCGILRVCYNSICKNIKLYPGASITIETKAGVDACSFKNENSYILIIPEITNKIKDDAEENKILELPCLIRVQFKNKE